MHPTPFWWYFDVSDMIWANFFIFRWHFFMVFVKMCSPLRQETQFWRSTWNIVLPFSTSKRPKLSLCWSCFSALSLCRSLLSPFIRSMPPKLDLKKRCKYVHFCYRWLPWTTWTMYPTSFWWHLHVFMYATLYWWHFDVSDMIWTAFFTFWRNIFIIFLKMCSPPAQEAQFEMAA